MRGRHYVVERAKYRLDGEEGHLHCSFQAISARIDSLFLPNTRKFRTNGQAQGYRMCHLVVDMKASGMQNMKSKTANGLKVSGQDTTGNDMYV